MVGLRSFEATFFPHLVLPICIFQMGMEGSHRLDDRGFTRYSDEISALQRKVTALSHEKAEAEKVEKHSARLNNLVSPAGHGWAL